MPNVHFGFIVATARLPQPRMIVRIVAVAHIVFATIVNDCAERLLARRSIKSACTAFDQIASNSWLLYREALGLAFGTMLSLVLFGVAFAECGLSTDLDPSGACALDSNGFPSMDADVDGVFSLTISTKGANTDTFNVEHPATVGALTDDTATDGRYILACKQVAGLKTVKMTISRPASMTAFGGEWVQLFPKDSWANVTNEYEPFTFNDYGAKIPLPEFRPTPTGTEAGGLGVGLTTEAVLEDTMNVFMEVIQLDL